MANFWTDRQPARQFLQPAGLGFSCMLVTAVSDSAQPQEQDIYLIYGHSRISPISQLIFVPASSLQLAYQVP